MTDKLSDELSSLRIDRSAPQPQGTWLKRSVVVFVIGAAIFAAVQAKPYLEAQVFKTSVQLTEIALVSPAQASVELTASGYVQADTASTVSPKSAGRVSKVYVRQGQEVKAGDPLLELDTADEQARISAAQSQVRAARAEAESAHARAEVAASNLAEARTQAARERTLADQGATGHAAAEDLEARAESLQKSVVASKAEAAAAEARAKALDAEVHVLQTSLDNLRLVAPIDGTIVNKPPQLGEFMTPAGTDGQSRGLEIADFSTSVVEVDIPEGRLDRVKVGGPAEIVLDAYPDRRLRGAVKAITPEVDRAKATVKVKVGFADHAEAVLPDMSARVSLLSKALDQAEMKAPPKLIVPGAALAERAGAQHVFVVEGDTVRMVPVQLGAPFGSGFELVKGPAAGTKVVSQPPVTLADGQKVKTE